MRYRIRWGKRGKLRFLSHHDEAPVLERAARRGGLPLAYNRGFTPRPKIAFGSGLPVGYGSEVELLDVELTDELPPDELLRRYNFGLPEGLVVHAAAALPRGAQSLGVLIQAASYRVGCDADWMHEGLERFLALDSFEMDKPHKGGLRKDDLRKGTLDATPVDGGFDITCAIKPRAIRPSDVFATIEGFYEMSDTPVSFQRTSLLTRRGDSLVVVTERTDELKVAS